MSLSMVVVMRNGFFLIKLLLRQAIQIFLRKYMQLQLNLYNISNDRNSGRDQETTIAYYRSKNNYYREPTCSSQGNTTIDQAQKGHFQKSASRVEGQQEKGRTINLVIRLLVLWGGYKKSHASHTRVKCTVLDLSKNQCRVGIIPIRFWLIAFRFSSIAPGGCFIGHDKDSH